MLLAQISLSFRVDYCGRQGDIIHKKNVEEYMTNKKAILLYNEKKECCGCGACMTVCPQKAIIMHEDEEGFLYPLCDNSKCIGCLQCKRACPFKTKQLCFLQNIKTT